MTITARLTGNRRDTLTSSVKALLIDLEGFDRNHCWIALTADIAQLQPLGHEKPIWVQIEAEPFNYKSRGETPQQTLEITKIQKIKKPKKLS